MMLISKEITNGLGIRCTAVNECETETLGLNISKPGKKYATFIESPKYISNLSDDINMIIVNDAVFDVLKGSEYGMCVVEDPRTVFFRLHNMLSSDSRYARQKKPSLTGAGCRISDAAIIAGNNVVIGEGVTIEENVIIRENTVIKDGATIRAGCVIGGEGFEFKHDGDKTFRVIHAGGVVIGKRAEVQYNTCIDKAIYSWDDTVLGDEVVVDNLVHIAHAVKIGRGSMIVAQSGIGGRVEIGDNAWIGFGATIRNGITIGAGSRVNMGAVVTKSVPDGTAVSGNFAMPHDKFIDFVRSR